MTLTYQVMVTPHLSLPEDCSDHLIVGSLNLKDTMGSRSTCSFTLRSDADHKWAPKAGQQVMITSIDPDRTAPAFIHFSGYIDDVNTNRPMMGGYRFHEVDCIDMTTLLDRHRVTQVFTDVEATDIITWCVNDADEGFHCDQYVNLPSYCKITKGVYDRRTVTEIIDELAKIFNLIWWVDPEKNIHCQRKDADPEDSGFRISEGSKNIRDFKYGETLEQWRDHQTVIGGNSVSDTLSETSYGNGKKYQFTTNTPIMEPPTVIWKDQTLTAAADGVTDPSKRVSWSAGTASYTLVQNPEITTRILVDGIMDVFLLPDPVTKEPQITLNGILQPVGVWGDDSDLQSNFLWRKPTLDADGTITEKFSYIRIRPNRRLPLKGGILGIKNFVEVAPPGIGESITVLYKGSYPIIVETRDHTSRDDMVQRSGNQNSWIEQVESQTSITDYLTAQILSDSLIAKYGSIPKTCSFETDTGTLRVGSQVAINLPDDQIGSVGVDEFYLIKSISTKDLEGKYLRASVECVSGAEIASWTSYYRMIAQDEPHTTGDDHIVRLQATPTETLQFGADTLNIVKQSGPARKVGAALVGYSEVFK